MMYYVLSLFLLTYILMLVFPKYKAYIAFIMAFFFLVLGIIDIDDFFKEIDFNILLMIGGTMGTVSLFIESKMPSKLSDIIIDKTSTVKWMTVALALFAGVISAFVDNVATVLMIAPVALELAKDLKINPVPILISISIFSNLEGAATLVGDTTAIMLASKMNLDFLDFFFYDGKIGLFFIVQIGLLASALILLFLERKSNKLTLSKKHTIVHDYVPTMLLVLTIISLIVASFIPNKPPLTNGIICLVYFVIGLIIKFIKTKDFSSLLDNIKEIDYETLLLLASLFVIIGGIKEAGVIDAIGNIITSFNSDSIILLYTVIVFVSVIISAFVDNIPYVATMLPVIATIGTKLGIDPTMLYYGLIIGATLGGNFTPIGASANIASIGILKKHDYEVSNSEYFKRSIPISLAAILTGYIVVLIMYI